MTPSEFIEDLRRRGFTVGLTKAGRLRVEPKAKPDDRVFIRENTPALLALLAFEAVLAKKAAASDAAQARLVAERDAAFRQRQQQYKHDRLAVLAPERVRAMVDAGNFSAQDVIEWQEAVDERLAGRLIEALLTFGTGRTVHVVRTADGEVAVEVGGPDGYRSSFESSYGKQGGPR